MSDIAANVNPIGGTPSRRIQRGHGHLIAAHAKPPPEPPEHRHTFSPRDRITLATATSIGGLLLLLIGLAVGIRQDIRDLRYSVWTIEDQTEWIRLASEKSGLALPDARDAIRRRLPGPLRDP